MSLQNLLDVSEGLKKYHKDSPYLKDIEREQAKRENNNPIYVNHFYN